MTHRQRTSFINLTKWRENNFGSWDDENKLFILFFFKDLLPSLAWESWAWQIVNYHVAEKSWRGIQKAIIKAQQLWN